MNDNMTATSAQKKELTAEALEIAGFIEHSEYPGVFTQKHGMKKIVKDLNITGKTYFLVDKKKVTEDDEYKTLDKVDQMITEAEDGQMPSRTTADIVVNTKAQDVAPEHPDDAQTDAEPTSPHDPTTHMDAPNSALVPLSTTTDIVRPAVSAQQAIAAGEVSAEEVSA